MCETEECHNPSNGYLVQSPDDGHEKRVCRRCMEEMVFMYGWLLVSDPLGRSRIGT